MKNAESIRFLGIRLLKLLSFILNLLSQKTEANPIASPKTVVS